MQSKYNSQKGNFIPLNILKSLTTNAGSSITLIYKELPFQGFEQTSFSLMHQDDLSVFGTNSNR